MGTQAYEEVYLPFQEDEIAADKIVVLRTREAGDLHVKVKNVIPATGLALCTFWCKVLEADPPSTFFAADTLERYRDTCIKGFIDRQDIIHIRIWEESRDATAP